MLVPAAVLALLGVAGKLLAGWVAARPFATGTRGRVRAGTVLIALVPLALILIYLLQKGVGALEWGFLFHNPKPVGEPGGGFANAIVGTLMVLVMVR